MRPLTIILLLAALAAPLAAPAEVIVIPLALPEVPLFLEAGTSYLVPFDAGRPLEDINQVGVRIKGTDTYFRDFCWTSGDYGAGQWWYRDVLGLELGIKDGGTILALTTRSYDPDDHPDDLDVILDTVVVMHPAGDWSGLADGTGTVVLTGLDCAYTPSDPEVCACDPSMTLTEAELVVTTGTDVPAAPTTWGVLKARYR